MIDTSRRLDGFPRSCDVTERPDGPRGIVYGCLRVYGHEGQHCWGNHSEVFRQNADGSMTHLGNNCDKACEVHRDAKKAPR